MLQFFDENGINPIPPGITVSLALASAPKTVVATAVTTVGGVADVTLSATTDYIAKFSQAGQAPNLAFAFTSLADPTQTTTASIIGYVSPVKSADDYAAVSTNVLYPRGWFSDAARAPGGVAYSIAKIFGTALATVDAQAQAVQGGNRLPSCVGSQIDSWVADYFGDNLRRFVGESDSAYITRALAMLKLPKCTRAAILFVVTSFYQGTSLELGASNSNTLSFDGGGAFDSGLGAFDETASYQPIMPAIDAWDRQCRPDLANQFGINPNNDDASFVIQISFSPPNENAWYLNHGYLNFDSYLIGTGEWEVSDTSPDPRLDALVEFVKMLGTKPIYLTAIVTP